MNDLKKFCGIILKRSEENSKSIKLLYEQQLYGNCISILRQELDSMVRVIYLLSKTPYLRKILIKQTLENRIWKEGKLTVRDCNMVDSATNLHGWARNVYDFGCAFVHLSSHHDYLNEDPFLKLPKDKLNIIKNFMMSYQGFPKSNEINLETMIPYLLKIFEKITGTLKCHLKNLEKNPNDTYVM
jgi:hypothetical protein